MPEKFAEKFGEEEKKDKPETEKGLLESIEARNQKIIADYPKLLEQEGVRGYHIRSPFWLLVREGIAQMFLGFPESGQKNLIDALELSRQRREYAEIKGEHYTEGEVEIRAKYFFELPVEVKMPVLKISPSDLQKFRGNEFGIISDIATRLWTSRVHLLATEGKVEQRMAQDLWLPRPLKEWNYPTGLMAGYSEYEALEQKKDKPVYSLYSLEEVRRRNIHRKDEEEFLEFNKELKIPRNCRRINRFIPLTPEIVQGRNQRLLDRNFVIEQGIEEGEAFWGKEMRDIAERTTNFYEDLFRHVIEKIIAGETFWGDENGIPLQRREKTLSKKPKRKK